MFTDVEAQSIMAFANAAWCAKVSVQKSFWSTELEIYLLETILRMLASRLVLFSSEPKSCPLVCHSCPHRPPGDVGPGTLVDHHIVVQPAPLPWVECSICSSCSGPVLIASALVPWIGGALRWYFIVKQTYPVSWEGFFHMQSKLPSKVHANRPVQLCPFPLNEVRFLQA